MQWAAFEHRIQQTFQEKMCGYLIALLRLERRDTLLLGRRDTYHNEIGVNLVYLCQKEAEKPALRAGDVNPHGAILYK